MTKVVAYIRVSTERQDVDNQLSGIREYADRERIHIDEVVGETISGYKSSLVERKLQEVLDELVRGDTLIVAEISRISRRLMDIMNTIQELLDRGVRVIGVKENIIFEPGIMSQIMSFMFGLAAEIERDRISQRTREALARKRAEGFKLGRPVGTSKPENLKLHGKEEEILDLLVAGVSKAAVARKLDVNRETLSRYMERQNLYRELLWRRHNKTGV